MAAIEVRSLTKRFGTVVAVDDVSFDVAPGKVTGFLGPNGAGKTTTLRMVLGLARPTSGERRDRGQQLRRSSPIPPAPSVPRSSTPAFTPAAAAATTCA